MSSVDINVFFIGLVFNNFFHYTYAIRYTINKLFEIIFTKLLLLLASYADAIFYTGLYKPNYTLHKPIDN